MHSAYLGLDCLTPESPLGKKVTVPVTFPSSMMDERPMKEAATKGSAVAPVGFLITSQLAVKPMAKRFMASLGRSRLCKATAAAAQGQVPSSRSPWSWNSSSCELGGLPASKQKECTLVYPLAQLSYRDSTAAGAMTLWTTLAGARQTLLPDSAFQTTDSKKKSHLLSLPSHFRHVSGYCRISGRAKQRTPHNSFNQL